MKYISTLLVASAAALSSAQVVYNETTGDFLCPGSYPNGAWCAGNSGETNIIIRCTNGVGQPGNCNDNLAGRPPIGVRFSPCYQPKAEVGDAACSRNCIVYPENGSAPFTIPGCTPTDPVPSSSPNTTTIVDPSHPPKPTNHPNVTTTIVDPSHPPVVTTTIVDPSQPPVITHYPNVTTTIIDPSHPPTTFIPSGTGTVRPPVNGTGTNPTRTPVGPTTTGTTPPQFTGAADKTSVSAFAGVLACVALFMM